VLSAVLHVDVTSDFLTVEHVVGPLVAAVVCVWALRHLPSIGLPRAMGLSLLAVVLLGPIVQPWYLLWGIAVLAITAGARTSAAVALLSVSVSLLGVVGLGQLSGELTSLNILYQLLFTLLLAAAVVVPIRTTRQGGTAPRMTTNATPWHPSPEWHLLRA
jgi:alpha-1,6-mannosyltransferase